MFGRRIARTWYTVACWLAGLAVGAAASDPGAKDWPRWGGSPGRNPVSAARNLPAAFGPGRFDVERHDYDPTTAVAMRWSVPLGQWTYGSPVVADGRVYLGYCPRRGNAALICHDAASGERLWVLATRWQLSPFHRERRLPDGRTLRYAFGNYGYCGTASVVGSCVYTVSPVCDLLCLDAAGQADGDAGPFDWEAVYAAGPDACSLRPEAALAALDGDLTPGTAIVDLAWPEAAPPDESGADIRWRYDLLNEQATWFEDAVGGSPLVHRGRVYVVCPLGIKRGVRLSSALPTLIACDAATGELVARDRAGLGPRVCHGNWSSPALLAVDGRELVVVGLSDGTCYAFAAEPVPAKEDAPGWLELVWRHDCNPPGHRAAGFDEEGRLRRDEHHGEIIATPVCHGPRVYVATGRDPGHDGLGPGRLVCIDATGSGDVTDAGTVWACEAIGRSVSSVAVHAGLVYAADIAPGTLYCLDAASGAVLWRQATAPETGKRKRWDDLGIWGSPLVADGRVYIGTGRGELWVMRAGRSREVLDVVSLRGRCHSSPVAAGDTLYVATHRHLYAFGADDGP